MPDFTITDEASAKVVLDAAKTIVMKAATEPVVKHPNGTLVRPNYLSMSWGFYDGAESDLLDALGVTP